MARNTTRQVLCTYLKEEVDPALLDFTAAEVHKVLYYSQEQFCALAGITEDQALSFFRAFGTDSFLAFKYILRKCLYYEIRDGKPVKRSLNSLSDEVLQQEIRNLTELSAGLDHDMVDRLAEDILSAPEVELFFSNAMEPSASALSRMLKLLGIRVRSFPRNSSFDETALDSIPPDALVIVFGHMRYSMTLLIQIKLLRQRGMRVVCFTDYPTSPYIPLSDYHFILPTASFDFTDSSTAGTVFMQILTLCVGMKREEDLYSTMHQKAIQTQENNMFW